MTVRLRGSFKVGHTPLNNPDKGWRLLAASETPGGFSQRLNTIELYGVDGVRVAGDVLLAASEIALSVAVMGEDEAEMLQRLSLLEAAFRLQPVLEYTPHNGKPRAAEVVVSSFTFKARSATVGECVITAKIPAGVWTELETRTGTLNPKGENQRLTDLSGGSGPARLAWHAPGAGYVKVTCAACGGEVLTVKHGGVLGSDWITGWDAPGLAARLEAFAPVCVGADGEYRVNVDSNVQVSWRGGRSFL